jgi:hypothetical protein
LEAFVVTDDGAWWHRWQIAPNGGWSDWDNSFLLERAVGHGDLAVGVDAAGRLQVFGSGGDLVHTWQDLGSDTLWFKGYVDEGPLGLGPALPVSVPPDSLGSPGDFPELLPWNWPVLDLVRIPPGGIHL